MSKNAPDTRNKLDSNKGIKKNPQPKKKLVKKKWRPDEIKEVFTEEKVVQPLPKKKMSKGQLFKAKYGISKTMYRNMKKHGFSLMSTTPIELEIERYRGIRRARKKAEDKVRQKKHADSVAYKRAHGRKKGSKGSTPATKTKKK